MAISADHIYSETLQSITDAKLEELVRKREAYESSKAVVFQAYELEVNEAEKVRILKEGIKTCFKLRTNYDGKIDDADINTDLAQLLQNLDRFLEQPRYDPSLSVEQLKTWAASLKHYFDVQSNRYEFASLYAKIVTEWLSSEKRMGRKHEGSDVEMMESFEELENSAKMESRQVWEQSVFQPLETDSDKIKSFLEELFEEGPRKKHTIEALEMLRRSILNIEAGLSGPSGRFGRDEILWCIEGLLSGDLLSEEKRIVLKDFRNNDVILSEIADVLNLRLDNIEIWSWGSPVPVMQRRTLAGQYNMHMQEDLLQAIFLQYIGVKWSVGLKWAFKTFASTPKAWFSGRQEVSKLQLKREDYFFRGHDRKTSLRARRNTHWYAQYFMTQLLTSESSSTTTADGAEEAEVSALRSTTPRTIQTARRSVGGAAPRRQLATMAAKPTAEGAMRHRKISTSLEEFFEKDMVYNDDMYNEYKGDKSMMSLKQGLLHLLRTEILFNTHLHGEITAFRTQYESWNSYLPHSTIIAVAEYLGISKVWLEFFRRFLQAPLGVMEGGILQEARVRVRGVPGSHPLSDVLGETILFCQDFHINQVTQGQNVWRIHDDLWFWSPDHTICVKAWSTINKFSELMGLSLDANRAGSARILKNKDATINISSNLPQNKIHWGFLYLDSQSGQWEIDETIVEEYTDELRRQLSEKGGSVLSWIEAWNASANTFVTTNFGKPAKCFGQAHTQKVLRALEKVQKRLFEGSDSHDVVDHLRKTLKSRFGIDDVPEGYCFFPATLGGLELRNPFISLLLIHHALSEDKENPERYFDRYEKSEREDYESAKKDFEKRLDQGQLAKDAGFSFDGTEEDGFMSFEEFTRYREDVDCGMQAEKLHNIFKELLQEYPEHQVTRTSDVETAMEEMDQHEVIGQMSPSINSDWHSMAPYWKWVTQMYGGTIAKRFGGLNIVDNGVLPIGMVSLFRNDRVQWSS